MVRKKKAWNMTNPLYRYLHGGGRKTRRRKGGNMGKRKGGRRFGGSRSGAPLGMLAGGMLGSMILGAGASMIGTRLIGSPLGAWTGPALGFAVGGPTGAIGALGAQMFLGSGSDAVSAPSNLRG